MDDAYRLTFVFEGDDVELASMRRVEMRVPPGRELKQTASAAGHFVELRDATGGALYRRPFSPPRPRGLEYPAEDGTMAWAETKGPVVVSVLVPASEGGRSVALVDARPASAGAGALSSGRRDLVSVELPSESEDRP